MFVLCFVLFTSKTQETSKENVKPRSREKMMNVKGIWPSMTVCLTEFSASSQTAVPVSELRKIRELYIVLKDVLRTHNAPGMNTEHKVCLEKCRKIRDEWRCIWPSLCKGLKQGETQTKALIFFPPYLYVKLLLLTGQYEDPFSWINVQFCHWLS